MLEGPYLYLVMALLLLTAVRTRSVHWRQAIVVAVSLLLISPFVKFGQIKNDWVLAVIMASGMLTAARLGSEVLTEVAFNILLS